MSKKGEVRVRVAATGDETKRPNDNFVRAGGSVYDDLNQLVVNQAVRSGFYATNWNEEEREKVTAASMGGMLAIEPKDAIEGMMAAQMVALHHASMECFRRAMLPDQTVDGRGMNLDQANKLTRSYATLVQALDKHRGKGSQIVRVEHVTVNEGGQAIVGNVEIGGTKRATATRVIEKATDEPLDVGMLATRGEYVEKRRLSPCNLPRDAAPMHERRGPRVDRQLCRTAVAGCTAGNLRGRQRARRTRSSTACARPTSSSGGRK